MVSQKLTSHIEFRHFWRCVASDTLPLLVVLAEPCVVLLVSKG